MEDYKTLNTLFGSQNFNRYSYALNNPLKYTDPSGYNMQEHPRYDSWGENITGAGMGFMRVTSQYNYNFAGSLYNAGYSTRSDGGYYLEGSYSYDKTHIQYLPAEGVGILGGWSNVRGNANVYRGSDGKYYANVSATGYTPSSTKGTVKFSGIVDVLVGNKVISSHSLQPYSGPPIIQSGRQDVGSSVFALPNINNDVYLRFNVGYSYSEGAGYVVPIPAQGHYRMQVGFTIDAWTY